MSKVRWKAVPWRNEHPRKAGVGGWEGWGWGEGSIRHLQREGGFWKPPGLSVIRDKLLGNPSPLRIAPWFQVPWKCATLHQVADFLIS